MHLVEEGKIYSRVLRYHFSFAFVYEKYEGAVAMFV